MIRRISGSVCDGLLLICAIPIVVFCRLISPILLVRFGRIYNTRLGHFVFDVGHYLTLRNQEQNTKLDCFFFEGDSANKFFERFTRRYVLVKSFFRYCCKVNSFLPFGARHEITMGLQKSESRDYDGVVSLNPPSMTFSPKDNQSGYAYLRSIGCQDDRFICVIAREPGYLQVLNPNRDWSYHDYRNTKIEAFDKTITTLTKRGYHVIRMGKYVAEKLDTVSERVIDYAASEARSEFLDIWLMANCQFCISTGTGLDEVAKIFKRPIVFVNYAPLFDFESYTPNITVFKNLEKEATGALLSVTEHLENSVISQRDFEERGLKFKSLSEEEICDAVMEMVDRREGSWVEESDAEQLQAGFWKIVKASASFESKHGFIHPEMRVGYHFLKNNHRWFLR